MKMIETELLNLKIKFTYKISKIKLVKIFKEIITDQIE